MKKIAIVVGATGLVGRSLVEQLVHTKHIEEIITITRRQVKHSSTKVVNHVVNFEHLEDYSSLLHGDLLFSCLGTTLKQAGSLDAQRRVDLYYQLKVAQIASSNGIPHYLLVSSSGANQNSKSPYLKMKGELEENIKALTFNRISIFQPSVLIGKRKEFRFGEKLASFVLPIICTLPWIRRFRPISGEEVAAKMVLVSQQTGKSFESFTLDEIFTTQ